MPKRTTDKSKRGRTGRNRAKRRGPSIAARADRHELYEQAVQAPDNDLEFFSRVFEELQGRPARSLREDFCGTAQLAAMWCKLDPKNTAIGVDIDRDTLDWGKARHIDPDPELAQRIRLICGDVREPTGEQVDFACALNFSFCVFKTRDELRRYLEVAREGLVEDGLLFLELYGGTEAIVAYEEEREVDGFTYRWDQASFNPLTHDTVCHIHFAFPDGSKIERAFTYEWRLWTVPELRELLIEAGFSDVRFFWEEVGSDDDDDELEGTGEYFETTEVENQESWIVYVVGRA
ncbi:MAG: class I SAM-dependent methyltransferase [Myxococcales bacterium FL481]|nr:MAG: class I SAM-dependent methyltransferase [Myxococcales bacterium FL481]